MVTAFVKNPISIDMVDDIRGGRKKDIEIIILMGFNQNVDHCEDNACIPEINILKRKKRIH
jgi:hypothetical protein